MADDENLIRNLFISSLSQYEDIQVAGQAANGEEVIAILKKSMPDVLLLDLNMPRLSGIEVLEQLNAEGINVKTLIISMSDNITSISAAINAGALGYLFKTEEWDEMHTAIKTVAEGKFYYTHKINSILLDMARSTQKNSLLPPKKKSEFTDRELSIIRHLNNGLSSSEIAERIYCSRATVDRIRQELIHRVGAKNSIGLISHAIQHKLVEPNNQAIK